MSKVRAALAAVAAAALAVPMLGSPAQAGDRHSGGDGGRGGWEVSDPIISGLVGPLGLAVVDDSKVLVAEAFANQLREVRTGRGPAVSTVVATAPGITGADATGDSVVFTSRASTGPPPGEVTATELRQLSRGGGSTLVADLWAFEQLRNPDRRNSYGFQGLSVACAAQVPEEFRRTSGGLDSHPYKVAKLGNGHVVADAGGNDIVRVNRRGQVSVVAVLPPIRTVVTPALQQGLGLPACTLSKTFNFEPVPTDVEVGQDGWLYVTSLPGGPEGGPEAELLGARGSVFKVNPRNGEVRKVAGGFAGAVDLALDGGTIYVAEMFGNKISRVSGRRSVTVVEVSTPAAIEFAGGKLWATIDALPPEDGPPNGKLVTISRERSGDDSRDRGRDKRPGDRRH